MEVIPPWGQKAWTSIILREMSQSATAPDENFEKGRKPRRELARPAPVVLAGMKWEMTKRSQQELVAEIEFRAWADNGKRRHASLKGVRGAADAGGIYEI